MRVQETGVHCSLLPGTREHWSASGLLQGKLPGARGEDHLLASPQEREAAQGIPLSPHCLWVKAKCPEVGGVVLQQPRPFPLFPGLLLLFFTHMLTQQLLLLGL